MNPLARIAHEALPSTAVLFRREAYGRARVREFLRDVMALANAEVDGPRHIVVGIEFDRRGRRHVVPVAADDFSGKPAYTALVEEHIEPAVRIRYRPVPVDGQRVGVFEISDCDDRPYMMRIDHSETLRRGDAYVRIDDVTIKMGRRQLQALFEAKFQDTIPPTNVEVGFAGEIIHKDCRIATRDLDGRPSALAGKRLRALIEAKTQVSATNTFVARLTHARLFGSDTPYEDRGVETMMEEMRQLEDRYRDEDEYFLFEQQGTELQLVVLNQGGETLTDATLSLVLPRHEALYVAPTLPGVLRNGRVVARGAGEQASYPAVELRAEAVRVTSRLPAVEPGVPQAAFGAPLRICVGAALAGRRLGIRYTLRATNLRSPASGTLRLLF
ncbi:MAG: ATP-binding protein [Woeseiaceae bacterium]|nr:ATP-binding protein [Woeseiaceae bacterium]